MSILLRILLITIFVMTLLGIASFSFFTSTVSDMGARIITEDSHRWTNSMASVFFEQEDFHKERVGQEDVLANGAQEKFETFSQSLEQRQIRLMGAWSKEGESLWPHETQEREARDLSQDMMRDILSGSTREGGKRGMIFYAMSEVLHLYVVLHDQENVPMGVIELETDARVFANVVSEISRVFAFLLISSFFAILLVVSLCVYVFVIRPIEHSVRQMEKLEKEL
jgi:hypothetical protein